MVRKNFLAISFVFLVIFFWVYSFSFTQVEEDLAFILKTNPLEKNIDKGPSLSIFHEVSEIKMAFLGLIRVYQLFISSQDKSVCNFTLSCSRFGMSAIQKFGLFHGFLMASDRVLRCNGYGRKYYSLDAKTGLSLDFPLDDYYLGTHKNELQH